MSKSNGTKRQRNEDANVDVANRPGWLTGKERIPTVGEEVFCAGGAGAVVAVLGKTGDGSRLLEIRLNEENSRPFFAAASNVLVAPANG